MNASSRSWLTRALEHACHFLPAQAPLEVFVHHNTLHAFEHVPFHEALVSAQEKLGAKGYLSTKRYLEAFRSGRIDVGDLDAAIAMFVADSRLSDEVPGLRELTRTVLANDIRTDTEAGLRWQLIEHRAATDWTPGVPAPIRDCIAHETHAWLRFALENHGSDEVIRLLVGDDVGQEKAKIAFEETFGEPSNRQGLLHALDHDAQRVAVAALWQACRVRGRGRSRAIKMQASRAWPRDLILQVHHEDPYDLVNPVLILLAGAFLDRGQSRWAMPDRQDGFFIAFCHVLSAGRAVRPSWLSELGPRLRLWLAKKVTAEEAIVELVDELGIKSDERAAFIEATLLALPGWAGMFRRLESAPQAIGRLPARVMLVDFLAVRLCLDVLAVQDVAGRLGHQGHVRDAPTYFSTLPRLSNAIAAGDHDCAWPLFLLAQHAGIAGKTLRDLPPETVDALLFRVDHFDPHARLRIWQEAYEHHYRRELLGALGSGQRNVPPDEKKRFQAVFCIDDREESIRRHFEEISPTHETYSTAGFFNLAIAYQGIDDPKAFPLCPVVVTPQHRVDEQPESGHGGAYDRRRRWRRRLGSVQTRFDRASTSVVLGPLVASIAGLLTALPLLAAVFAPWLAGRLRRKVAEWLLPTPKTRLSFREEHAQHSLPPVGEERDDTAAIAAGFSIDEKVVRVGTLLRSIGLTSSFARVVAIVGHDSSSVNNPHFAAYSCGACGGRSGAPNARLFARMANRQEVRDRLREVGIDIPNDTLFVGAAHDTCADRIDFFDVDSASTGLEIELRSFSDALARACSRNAHERSRKFESAPWSSRSILAHRHVEARSYDLSQPRPELGHATNAACVVGRRALTQHLFLDRRVFLSSYDPTQDPQGTILEQILMAVVPVAAGINLEYFFSSTDPEGYGAGTKLPHNVTGLVGVMNGSSSDLRTGLPVQMTEIHEPIRLQLVVEHTNDTVLALMNRQSALAELVNNDWVSLSTIHPHTRAIHVYRLSGGFVPAPHPPSHVPVVARSSDWYSARSEFLAPARIDPSLALEHPRVL